MKTGKEEIMRLVFLLAACASIALVAMICVFLFGNGLPTIGKIGVTEFFLGETWRPNNDLYGILPMILGSAYVTLGAIVVGVPIGILTAVFMARFCPDNIYRFLKPAVELLAGIPSVVYGFFGLVVMVPFIRDNIGGTGSSMLTASLLLAMMILPTLISVAEAALRAVPNSYYEGALALGAGHVRSVFFTIVPAAKSGIMAAIILGLGRAVGETMAVIMVAGNQARMPQGLLEGVRTMTTNIVIEMGYAADMHRDALIATAVVLFIFILIINLTFSYLKGKVVQQ
ncbi:MAG TPA: phosphate ABC transporter permease subunit PstC [Candidatus Phascolarctobacterium stercoravium]|nr:phosphate ABC transporter permease subunit PstC [Candidatus Phascolarctobacterium stercoravium]